MAAVTYSIAISTGYNGNGVPDPNTAHGVLFSNGASTAWPADLTTVSIAGLRQIGSATPTKISNYRSDGKATGVDILGQFFISGTPVAWPPTLQGILVNAQDLPSAGQSPHTTNKQPSQETTVPEVATDGGSATSVTSSPGLVTHSPPSAATGSTSTDTSGRARHTGLSTGATAGIAIGCALVGIMIGLIIACLLLRRKGKRYQETMQTAQPYELDAKTVHQTPIYELDAKGFPEKHNRETLMINSAQQKHQQLNLNQFLLEATPDREIVHEVQALGALIDQHTEGYYHFNPITVDAGSLIPTLARLGLGPEDAQLTTSLCLDPSTRRAGLRHAIMRMLFGSIDMRSPRYATMLPVAIRTFLQSTPSADTDRYGNPQAYSLALRKWRIVSAYLLHPARSQRTTLPVGDPVVVEHQAQEVAEALNGGFLRFFVLPAQQTQQAGHLHAMFVESAKLGRTLFSHPSDWEFVYEATGSNKSKMQGVPNRGVVVEAGLNKLTDRDEAPFVSRQTIIEPVVVQY